MNKTQTIDFSEETLRLIENRIKKEKKKLIIYIIITIILLIVFLVPIKQTVKDDTYNTIKAYKNNSFVTFAKVNRLHFGRHFTKYVNISYTTLDNKVVKEDKKINYSYYNFLKENNIEQIPIIYLKTRPKNFEILSEEEILNKEIFLQRIEKEKKNSIIIGISVLFFIYFIIIIVPISRMVECKRHKRIYLLKYYTRAKIISIVDNATSILSEKTIKYFRYVLSYTFSFENKEYKSLSTLPILEDIKIGSMVEIAFDPKKPKMSFIINRYNLLNKK